MAGAIDARRFRRGRRLGMPGRAGSVWAWAGAGLLAFQLGVAAADSGSESEQRLADMVVTAAPESLDLAAVPANVSVITAADIAEMNAATIPDVLKYLAGVNVADWTGSGRSSTVDIRGFGETAGANVLVLVDGRRVNAPDLSGTDWTTIPLERIARIEVVRGGAGTLYGDNATAGVINIITRKGEGRPTFTSETTVGSNSEFGQRLTLSGGWGALGYVLDGSYRALKGYRTNSYFRNRSSGIRLSFDPQTWVRLDFSAGVKRDHYGLPGTVGPGQDRESSNSPYDHARSTDWYLHFTPEFQLAVPGELRLQTDYRQRYQHAFFHGAWGDFVMATRISEYGFSPTYKVGFNTGNWQHALSVGVSYFVSNLHDLNATSGWPPVSITDDKYRREVGYFAYDRIRLPAPNLYLDLGYRRGRIKYLYDNYDNRTWGECAGRFGITWNYAPGSKLFAAFDKSWRTQLLDEFGGPWGAGLPLAPQTTRHWQAGVRHALGRRLVVAATAFQIDTDNEIFYDPSTWQNVSYPKTRRRGIELELQANPVERVHCFANFTWMNPELRNGAYDGNRIPGVAKQSASAGVSVRVAEGLEWDLRGRWVKRHPSISDWANTLADADGFMVVDTKLRYTYPRYKWLTVYVGVSNLLGEEYSEYVTYGTNRYPAPERTFLAGVRIQRRF